tara:strand:+ start:81 stop:719 length:639 start_codon:yes stop_codon:yes gene_type:complete
MDEHLLRFKKDTNYVLIDCETENLCLHSMNNLPWQIGMIKAKGENKVDEQDLWLSWDREIDVSEGAAKVTHFNFKNYKKRAKDAKKLFPIMRDWLDNADYIIGHNILGFDIYLLKDYYNYMGLDYKHLLPKIIDTNCIAKGIKYGFKFNARESFISYQYKVLHTYKKGFKTNLRALGEEFEIDFDPDKLHEALYDLELNLKVWNRLKCMIEL